MKGDKFLENLDEDEMKRLVNNIDEKDFEIDDITKKRIENKVIKKIKKKNKKSPWKIAGLAAAILLAFSLFNPTVLAYMKGLLYFVPEVGPVVDVDYEILIGEKMEIKDENNLLVFEPVIITKNNIVEMTFQINRGSVNKTEETFNDDIDFDFFLNGKKIEYDRNASGGGWSQRTTYALSVEYNDEPIKVGDTIELRNEKRGIDVKTEMVRLEAKDPESLPRAEKDGITIYANVVKTDEGYDIYTFSEGENIKVEPIYSYFSIGREIYFINEEGERFEVKIPEGWGSMLEPPLKIKGNPGKGELIIPGVEFYKEETVSYTFKIPNKDEILEPKDSFTLAEFEIQVDKVYWDEVNKTYALDLSWETKEKLSLTSLGYFSKGIVYSSFNSEEGTATVGIDDSKIKNGKMTIEPTDPRFAYKNEYKIPLDLK